MELVMRESVEMEHVFVIMAGKDENAMFVSWILKAELVCNFNKLLYLLNTVGSSGFRLSVKIKFGIALV